MVKELFGWLIAVCRRWALGSSYDNKTSRARYGVALVCGAYILGVTINPVFYFGLNIPEWVLTDGVVEGGIIASFVAPMLILRRVFKKNIADHYIQKYEAKSLAQNVKQQSIAFFFCFGGWFTLFGPFFIYKFFFYEV